jgi:hypothetical protein
MSFCSVTCLAIREFNPHFVMNEREQANISKGVQGIITPKGILF